MTTETVAPETAHEPPSSYDENEVVAVSGNRPYTRVQIGRIGLWLFIASESFLFAALLTPRFYMWETTPRPEDLDQVLGLIITSILLLSSWFAYRAETRARYGDPYFTTDVFWTIVLGFVFMAGVALEWTQAASHFPPSTGFGTLFFSITGFHAFHVLTGVIFLIIIWRLGRRGWFGTENHWWVEASVKYWHFVDVVWVFVYPSLYLVNPG